MICESMDDFAPLLPAFGAIAGLDLGTKTIGVSVSDSLRSVATPLSTIRREKFTLDVAQLLKITDAREIKGIVLGLPMNMDGSEGPRCQSTRAFARNLEKLTPLPITFWDERLSTVAAERAMLGYTYAEVGAGMAEKWQFPEEMVSALSNQFTPFEGESYDPLAGLIHLATTSSRP